MQTTWFLAHMRHTARRITSRRGAVAAAAGLALILAACQPIIDPNAVEGQVPPDATEIAAQPDATESASTPEATATPDLVGLEPAQATISTSSLRVRAEPNEDSDVVAGVRQGETYPVIGISSDGEWVQIEIDRAPDGTGWVSSSFVTLAGDITNIPITFVAEESATEESATEEATEEATDEATEEPAEEATEEPTEEVADEPTEEPAEEATEEPTEVATEEPAEEVAEEPAEEATEEPADEATEEPTEEATEEATEEPTEEVAEEPAEEPVAEETPTPQDVPVAQQTPTPTPELADPSTLPVPAPGYVVINSGRTPLRVRSEPSTATEDNKVGHVFTGETYRILEISEDGQWIRIDVPQLNLPDGGWIFAEFAIIGE